MSDKPSEPRKTEPTPNGVGKLYSFADAPGTRYRGFSASRQQIQEQFRARIARAHAERAGVEPAHIISMPAVEETPEAQAPSQIEEVREIAITPNFIQASPFETLQELESADEEAVEPPVALPPGFAQRPPAVAVFSLVPEVGKTCMTATLGRALSALGERVLLVDTALTNALPFYFGAREGKPGVVRKFSPPAISSAGFGRAENETVRLLHLEAERFPLLESGQDWLLGKLVQESRGLSRILIDVATAGRELRRLLLLRPLILVPLIPEMDFAAGLEAIESLLGHPGPDSTDAQVYFVLNQFDLASAQHQKVRELLQPRLGDRLLPFVLRNSATVGEALAEGMTVMDYAPDAETADDYRDLAEWLRSIVEPAPWRDPSSRHR